MTLNLLILIICSLAITSLGLVIFTRNPQKVDNQRFAFMSLSLMAWTGFNYLSDNASSHVLLFTRLTFLGGVAAFYGLISFMVSFPNETIVRKNIFLRIHRIFTFVLLPLTMTPYFVSSVTIDANGGGSVNTTTLYYLFLIYILYSLVLLIVAILSQNKHAKSAVQRQQVSLISWGVILYAVLALSSNVILPLLIDDWSSSRFGPVFTLVLVGMVAYAIIRHRLFDVRLVVARSLAYIVVVGGGLGLYTLLVVLFSQKVGFTHNQELIKNAVPFIAALLIAILFRPIKRYLDRITNKFLYQDAYDAQTLLDQLNAVLVSTIEPQQLLDKSAEVVVTNIKAEFVHFKVTSQEREYSNSGLSRLKLDEKIFTGYSRAFEGSLVVTDDLEGKDQAFKEFLQAADIAMVVQLSAVANNKKHLVGYIFLGNKKSGWPYSTKDVRIIEIIANELVIAIQNALRFEEIQNFASTLQEKVDDATHKLRKTNEKLRQLDETKDDFISMASHQLRTPLTSVKGYVSMVLDGDAGKISKQQDKLLQQAFISSQRMVYLIADLLNVSRLKTGKFVIEAHATNLIEVVESELNQLQETAKGRGLKLDFVKPKSIPLLNLDETKVRQVIMNFTDNAIYYTPSGGTITVNLVDKPNAVELTVVDNGIGVPKAEQHHLFTKFYRAGNAKKARPDGTGLGLFMAQKVIIAQGGAIIFHSEENKGSTFGFSFPKSKLVVEHDAPAPAADKNTQA